ncbi:MAG: AraC family transcriptional regulator [Kofleriaceae bacterium]|nr:AraC family transcriptional regulator [Kofleriaceae bacterium]
MTQRIHLAFDTRFSAAAAGRVERVGHVFLVVRGRFAPAGQAAQHGPICVVLADDEIERVGPKSRSFRTDGDAVDIVHLRFARDELRVPIGLEAGALALPPSCWKAAGALLDRTDALQPMLDELASAGITRGTAKVHAEESDRQRLLWDAIHPLYETYGATTSLKQLAAKVGLSTRQVGRDVKQLARTFGFGLGYRDALLAVRLRSAVLLLSAPGATVAQVATAVGYGGSIALGRAFRDAKLPPPADVQAALRGG